MGDFERRLNLRLREETYSALEEFAVIENKSLSAVVRDLLDQSAPYLRQLALAYTTMHEAIARGAVADAAQGVKLFQQVAVQMKSGAGTMETLGEMMESEFTRAEARIAARK